MGKEITHPDQFAPWRAWLSYEKVAVDGPGRFADLDQTHPNGIEDESIAEIAAREVPRDDVTRVGNVIQPLAVISAHSG